MPISVCCEVLFDVYLLSTVLGPGDSVVHRQSQCRFEGKELSSGSREIAATVFYFKCHW